MRRDELFKQFDIKTRNQIRSILSDPNGNAIKRLSKLRKNLGPEKLKALDSILESGALTKASKAYSPFPKTPPFSDSLQEHREINIHKLLASIETSVKTHEERLKRLTNSLNKIDNFYAQRDIDSCIKEIKLTLKESGWSHAILRRTILIRENLEGSTANEEIEKIVRSAGIKKTVVSSLIHAYSRDQNILMTKRSILNFPDKGVTNRYSRTLSKLSIQPFAASQNDLEIYIKEVLKCSLIDAIILAKFNAHLFCMSDYPSTSKICEALGNEKLFDLIIKTYDNGSSDGEYTFFKQSSAWLEYDAVRQYRILIDNYFDSSRDQPVKLHLSLQENLEHWVGDATLQDLVGDSQYTSHQYSSLAKIELTGTVTRSAMFNYWLTESEGQIAFSRNELLKLMELTRDLARTIPIRAVRTAAKLAKDELVKLILFLLLAKRSKNELDGFLLKKLLEEITIRSHNRSLVELVRHYESENPAVAEYIYDIATEDFLSKLTRIAPHRADIPEIRASLHEWMAHFSNDTHYLQRARAVRIDHQINRVRNEIDDHRIYVDPSRFTSWIEDEMMFELNNALTTTGSGKKEVSVSHDESVLFLIMTQSYNAFCSNAVFGIASYIGRRIRHGTFHGHLYSSVINTMESSVKYKKLLAHPAFLAKWAIWKEQHNAAIEEIIANRLHVQSKTKPLGLLTPDANTPAKQEVFSAAVEKIIQTHTETSSTSDICPIIIDYCWRLAELDLVSIIRFLKSQQSELKNEEFLKTELVPTGAQVDRHLAEAFKRDLGVAIDRKLSTMYGWFKRPSIIAPKASVSLLFDATVAEVKDTIPDFNPQAADASEEEIELVGGFYHLVYDSLAIVVGNAAKYADRRKPLKRKFQIIPGKEKKLVVEITSSIKPSDSAQAVSQLIEARKTADYQDANLYDRKSGISKLLLLANNRHDFELNQYEVVGNEVKARLIYALEH